VRITGGAKRGRRLAQLKDPGIRPTSDRAREAVFNILGQDLTGCRVLDLFAGTGAFGIDALSRGAVYSVFVDNSPQAVALIKKNLTLCGLDSKASVVNGDLRIGIDLGNLPETRGRFDTVFIDPPYGSGLIARSCGLISAGGLLEHGACVVAETSRNESVSLAIEGLISAQVKIYGDTKISIFYFESA
jgi:16S rRNA (guanine966-N2)-methyltransferase